MGQAIYKEAGLSRVSPAIDRAPQWGRRRPRAGATQRPTRKAQRNNPPLTAFV